MWTAAIAIAWKYALVVAQIKAILNGNLAAHSTKRKITIGFGGFFAYGLVIFTIFVITICVSAPHPGQSRAETSIMMIIVTTSIFLLTVILLGTLYLLTKAVNQTSNHQGTQRWMLVINIGLYILQLGI